MRKHERVRLLKYDFKMNLVLIGDSGMILIGGIPPIFILLNVGVGKTSLFHRFHYDSFESSSFATIGIDVMSTKVQCGGKVVKLKIWDFGGQERFQPALAADYRGSKGILLVYDVSDEVSFINVRNWMKQINQNAPPDVNVMLIGNKCDADPSERVS